MSTQPMPRRSTPELLASVREEEAFQRDSEIRKLKDIVAWAENNTVEAPEDAATITDGRVDTGLPLAGEGAPLVSEFALMELAACLGRSTAGGREYVGKVIETAFRLPSVWEGVIAGRIPVWRALKIADATRLLSAEAAAYVDHHLAEFAATCTFAQVERLVEEALSRFDPETAEQRRREAAEGRRFDIDTDDASIDGTVHVDGELDLADGLDLEAAIARRAEDLARLGSEDSRDVRRAKAAGELARADQTLDLPDDGESGLVTGRRRPSSTTEDSGLGGSSSSPRRGTSRGRIETSHTDAPEAFRRRPGRKVELHVHLTDTAIEGVSGVSGVSTSSTNGGSTNAEVGRLANTRTPITPEQIREWCGNSDTTVIVRPIVDLAGHDPVDAYEIPDRHRRQVTLRDPHCRFPHCNQPASRCDLDHAQPYDAGGPTCPCNLVPLCRRHHRAKTHSPWRYVILDPGMYLWTSPGGYQYLVDHRGTRDLSDDAVVSRLASSHLNHRHQP